MKYNDIIESEKRPTKESLNKIILHKEKDWWRAYEWSAYLSLMFPNDLDEKSRFKVKKKPWSGLSEGIVFIGLQLSSFGKYFPNVELPDENATEMEIDISKYLADESFELDTYTKTLSKWKEQIPFYKPTSLNMKETNNSNVDVDINSLPFVSEQPTLFSIIGEIMEYPLEDRTPIENYRFIGQLKNHSAKLICSK